MGGALFELGRVQQKEYLEIEKELVEYLNKRFPRGEGESAIFRIPRFYDSKPDFGDVDILLAQSVIPDWTTTREEIVRDLNVTKYQTKGDLSMAYKDLLQVDIMPVPDQYLDSTWQFLCYNDLGNLLGKHYRRFNLKYGEKGLFYVFRRSKGSYVKDIPLTTDMKSILGFLDLSYDRWNEGFASLEEMFDWVISCKYFTAAPFITLSKATKKRSKLRTTMKKFIAYVEEKNITKAYPFEEDKALYLPRIQKYFSDVPLAEIIEKELQLEQREGVINAKFNGKILMAMFPELKGPALGAFITGFKESFNDFQNEIFELPQEEIAKKLEIFHSSVKAV